MPPSALCYESVGLFFWQTRAFASDLCTESDWFGLYGYFPPPRARAFSDVFRIRECREKLIFPTEVAISGVRFCVFDSIAGIRARSPPNFRLISNGFAVTLCRGI